MTLLVLIATIVLTGYLFVHVSKGFFPQQDTGTPGRVGAGRSGQLISGDERSPAAAHRDRQSRSGCGQRRGLHRRRGYDQYGAVVHRLEAARRSQRAGRPDHCTSSPAPEPGPRRNALPAGVAGRPRRRAPEQRPVSVHDAGRQPDRSAGHMRPGCCNNCGRFRSSPT